MRGITVLSLLNLALRNIVALIISAVICAGCAYVYCEYFAVERYSATGAVLITNDSLISQEEIDENGNVKKLQGTDISVSMSFVNTAIDMLKHNDIYKLLAQKTDNRYAYGTLASMANVIRRSDNSLYVDITFTAATQDEALNLVNEYMALIPDYLTGMVKGVKATYSDADSAEKVFPRTMSFVTTAAVIGTLAVYGVFFLIFFINATIVTERDIKERFDVTIIGSIPDFATAKSKKYGKYYRKYGYYGYND